MEKEIIWNEVNFKYKIRVIEDVKDKSEDALYLIKLSWKGRSHTTSYKNTFYLYEIEVFDKDLRYAEIYIGEFKIQTIYHSYANNFQDNIDFQFVDCSGIKEKRTFYVGLIENFEEAINFLVIRKHCNTFKEYDLEQKIIELEGKVNKFEDKLSQIKEITLSTLKLLE